MLLILLGEFPMQGMEYVCLSKGYIVLPADQSFYQQDILYGVPAD